MSQTILFQGQILTTSTGIEYPTEAGEDAGNNGNAINQGEFRLYIIGPSVYTEDWEFQFKLDPNYVSWGKKMRVELKLTPNRPENKVFEGANEFVPITPEYSTVITGKNMSGSRFMYVTYRIKNLSFTNPGWQFQNFIDIKLLYRRSQ